MLDALKATPVRLLVLFGLALLITALWCVFLAWGAFGLVETWLS